MSEGRRDASADGWSNRLEIFLLAGMRPFWAFVNAHPKLARLFNGLIIDRAVKMAPPRPLALSTMHPYSCWSSLTDRSFFSRYLPPSDTPPPTSDLEHLFAVPAGRKGRESPRSTLLFPMFAQWFTDGFLVTDEKCRSKTHTNHQIDLSQLYGLTPAVTDLLREKRGGRLMSQMTGAGEFAPFLSAYPGWDNPSPNPGHIPRPSNLPGQWPSEKTEILFAFGGDRANSTVFTAAVNTLFLRHHNWLCEMLERCNLGWDDERLFETARNINIVTLIKVVVEEYINHISPYWFKLLADPTIAYRATWNRENWIPVEFNLLYRWHSLVPETIVWNGEITDLRTTQFDNSLLLRNGLAAVFEAASASPAWRLGLLNTSAHIRWIEQKSVEQGRANRLRSYNDYRKIMNFPPVTRFEQISGDSEVVEALLAAYDGDVDKIEYFVGLLAEDLAPRAAVPPLIGRMVAADAFSHALTNPLLSPAVYNKATFTQAGLNVIAKTSSLRDILARVDVLAADTYVSMDRRFCHASVADPESASYKSLVQKGHIAPQTKVAD